MNLNELKELIELISEKGFTEFEIERQGFRMRISRAPEQRVAAQMLVAPIIATPGLPGLPAAGSSDSAASAGSAQPVSATVPETALEPAEEVHIIKSIMVGTFYSTPKPTSEPFVKIGDRVEPETVVCIIEAMKLMNPIQAEVTGELVKIFVENGQPVEYGQPLFGVRTA